MEDGAGGGVVEDLLRQAQREVWAAARSLPVDGGRLDHLGRLAAAGEARDAHLAAWPALAAAARCALTTFAADPAHRREYHQVSHTLIETSAHAERAAVTARTPEPHLVHAAERLRTAVDAVADAALPTRFVDLGGIDAVLAVVETAATQIAVYAEQARSAERINGVLGPQVWLGMARVSRDHLSTPGGRRADALTHGARPAPGDASLEGALDRWRRAAERVTEPTPCPSSDLVMITAGFATLYGAAASTERHDGYAGTSQAWLKAWQGFTTPHTVTIPGAVDPTLRAATLELRTALVAHVAAHHDHGPLGHLALRGTDRHLRDHGALTYFTDHRGPGLAIRASESIDTVLRSELAAISARSLVATHPRPVPVDLARASLRGQWYPLPADHPTARALGDTTKNATALTTRAAQRNSPQPATQTATDRSRSWSDDTAPPHQSPQSPSL